MNCCDRLKRVIIFVSELKKKGGMFLSSVQIILSNCPIHELAIDF